MSTESELGVLVVDDEAGMRSTIVDILSSVGIEADAAPSATVALERVQEWAPGLVLTDYRLPDMTGVDLATRLKQVDPDLAVVVMTGYASLEAAVAAVGQVQEFLTKPVPPDQLVRAVRGGLERTRLSRENRRLLFRLQEANATLEARVAERTRVLSGLLTVSEAISPWLDLARLGDSAVESVCAVTGAKAAAMYVGRPYRDELELVSAKGFADAPPPLLTSSAQLGADVHTVPLDAGGSRVGALMLERPEVDDPAFFVTLGTQVAFAVQNARRYEVEQEAVQRLSELSQMKSTFLAMASHELRTPLTVVLGFAETLRDMGDSFPESERQRLLDRLVAQANRLNRLVSDLLDATRVESGRLQVDVERVDLAEVLERVLEGFPDDADRVEVNLPGDVRAVRADADRLGQAVTNLVQNALKYSPAEEPVMVEADAVTPWVRLRVIDRGLGIDPAFMRQLFEPFTQADTGDTRRERGLGLGLYITRGLIEAMGGRVEVTSQRGRGTTFSLLIPAA